MLDFFLLPFRITLEVMGRALGDDPTGPLTRRKKQEAMRRHPDWFDDDGNFTGIPERKP